MSNLDFQSIKTRVFSLVSDLEYVDDVLKSKSGYETNLWAIREQKKLETNISEDMQKALQERENVLLKQINNCDKMLEATREKILRALGKM
jgi:hypothetical protein